MYKALSVRCQRCTKKITLRCMVIGTCAVQFLCASGAETRFSATDESSTMLCTPLQRNEMLRLNCACAYSHTAEHNIFLILLLRTALAPYWQSLVHFNCACSITIRYYYTRSRKSKWRELVAKYQVQWARITMNTRLDTSVRIKTRIRTRRSFLYQFLL